MKTLIVIAPTIAQGERYAAVLGGSLRRLVVVTPRAPHRARGVIGHDLRIHPAMHSAGKRPALCRLIGAVAPSFATSS